MIIPKEKLQKRLLHELLKSLFCEKALITGLESFSLVEVKHVNSQLDRKDAFIVFDSASESISIVAKDSLPPELCR